MKRTIIFILAMLLFPVTSFSQVIIADHTVVDKYDDIPQAYIDAVKKMWISIAGESHSEGYRVGCELLEALDSRFQVNVTESGTPEAYTTSHLRISRATWGDVSSSSGWIYSYGEEDWFTSTTAINRTKAGLLYIKNNGPALTALGFGWCYDASYPGVKGTYDPVFYTRWGGETVGGPQSPSGGVPWGLDAADQTLTGNSVCLDTYLNATDSYIAYCTANSIATKIIFTTGPVDENIQTGLNDGEIGYQQFLKYERIRNHVKSLSNAFLFDYADILCYNNAGQQNTTSWTNNNGAQVTYPLIHNDNIGGNYVAHIGSVGALRLGKAMWWLLARMAGWDGGGTGSQDLEDPTSGKALNVVVQNNEIRIQTNEKFLNGNLNVFNIAGNIVDRINIVDCNMTLNSADYAPGIYIIVATKNELKESQKIALVR